MIGGVAYLYGCCYFVQSGLYLYFKGGRVTRPKTKSDPEWMNDPVSTPTAVKMGSVWVPLHETALKLAITGTK